MFQSPFDSMPLMTGRKRVRVAHSTICLHRSNEELYGWSTFELASGRGIDVVVNSCRILKLLEISSASRQRNKNIWTRSRQTTLQKNEPTSKINRIHRYIRGIRLLVYIFAPPHRRYRFPDIDHRKNSIWIFGRNMNSWFCVAFLHHDRCLFFPSPS